MTRTVYLCYARTGYEIEVGEELEAIGIPCWVARVINWERLPTKRRARPVERPAWPNYVFADMTPHDYYRAAKVKQLVPFFRPVPDKYRRVLAKDRERIEEEYAVEMRKVRRQDLLRAEFTPGQEVRMSDALGGLLGTFRRVVEEGDMIRYEIEASMMGRTVRVLADPLELKRAV